MAPIHMRSTVPTRPISRREVGGGHRSQTHRGDAGRSETIIQQKAIAAEVVAGETKQREEEAEKAKAAAEATSVPTPPKDVPDENKP